MAEAPRRPLLTLTTIAERPTVKIDGVEYEMRDPDELTIVERQRQAFLGRRMRELSNKDGDLTDGEKAELTQVTDEACRRILLAPEEIHQKLLPGDRHNIFDAFFVYSLRRSQQKLAPAKGDNGRRPGKR